MTIPMNNLLAQSMASMKTGNIDAIKNALDNHKALVLIHKQDHALQYFIKNGGTALFFFAVHVDGSAPYGFSLMLEQATANSDDILRNLILNKMADGYDIYMMDETLLSDVRRTICVDPDKHTIGTLTPYIQIMIACQFMDKGREKDILVFDKT